MGSNRVQRGGSWINHAQNCRSAQRNWWHWHDADDNDGFRLARAPERVGRPTPDPTLVRSVGLAPAAKSDPAPACK